MCRLFLFLLEPGFQQFKMSERLHANWIRLYLEDSNSEVLVSLGTKVRRQYLDALRTLSLSLSRQVAHYDAYSMAVGTVVVLEVRCSWWVVAGGSQPSCRTDLVTQPELSSSKHRVSENGKQ